MAVAPALRSSGPGSDGSDSSTSSSSSGDDGHGHVVARTESA